MPVVVVVLQHSYRSYRKATCDAAGHLKKQSERTPVLLERTPSLVLDVIIVFTYYGTSQIKIFLWRWSTSPVFVFGYTSQCLVSQDPKRVHSTQRVRPMQSVAPSHDIRSASELLAWR